MAGFDALLRFTSLSLCRRLGTEVVPVLSRKELAEPALRAAALTQQLASTGQLTGVIRIPDTVGHLTITADLRASTITCHVDVDAPREGRPTTRVKWLVRQLKNAPDSAHRVHHEAETGGAGGTGEPLAFDHRRTLGDGVERARAKLEDTGYAAALCGETFLRRRPARGLRVGVGHRARQGEVPPQGHRGRGLPECER